MARNFEDARVRLGEATKGVSALCVRRPVLTIVFNLRAEPEVCIELAQLYYAGVTVRRRVTGAYALGGLLEARARLHGSHP